jgi:hexosaminidase
MMKRIVESLFLLLMVGCCQKQPAVLPALIPQPKQLTQQQGVYQIPQQLVVAYDNEMLLPAIDFLRGGLPADVDLSARFGTKGDVCLLLDTQLTTEGAYQIDVTRRNVTLRSGSYQGMISAIATLRQLVSLQSSKQLPYLHIEDAPSLAWRGFMLDVSRHFFSKEEVMALLEKMACYKFNKFHWHLTDDQGWRIEIKRYPELTEQGAWRDVATHDHDKVCAERAKERDDNSYLLPLDKLKDVDGKPYYGGYYTQDEIREVVTYAATLGIDVIPEIDMPGHSLQSVHCYPSLSCTGKASWGETFSTPLCLGNDATLEFCKNIYSELFDLFPYEYVHIGADEVEKTNWKKCPKCQQRIAEHHLLDEKGLQAWFVRDMEHFFAEHGRRMVGWDEIAEDSLSQTAVIMWWRSWMPQTLSTALKNGNEVILSPVEYLYLDDAQNRNSLLKSYGFTPADSLMHQYMPQIKGMQTHLWTEYIPSFDKACYHLFPRFFAASELAWSGFSQGDASDFEHRAVEHLQRLDAEGWNYRIPDIEGFCDENVFIDSLTVTLRKPFASIAIHVVCGTAEGNQRRQANRDGKEHRQLQRKGRNRKEYPTKQLCQHYEEFLRAENFQKGAP